MLSSQPGGEKKERGEKILSRKKTISIREGGGGGKEAKKRLKGGALPFEKKGGGKDLKEGAPL